MKSALNWTALALFLVVLTVPGCGPSLRVRLSEPVPNPCTPQVFKVGAAKVDITPMPGYAMGGHGPGGTVSRGYWQRLYARAVYMEDNCGQSLVFVSCDLWSMPGGLADRVAELVHEKLSHIGREQIILAATHTHQSPGNFSTAKTFNDFGSRRSGFDAALFDFLADRIARAIKCAYDGRRQCLAFHRTSEPVERLFRNRSVEAFTLNLDSDDIIGSNTDLPIGNAPTSLRQLASYHAIDPRVTTLRFGTPDHQDSQGNLEAGETIAILAFVAVHPETMSAATQVYSSDLFGVAASTVEQRLKERNAGVEKPVVAIFNGAEGDVSADWNRQDRNDAVSLGCKLAEAVFPDNDPTRDEVRIQNDIQFRYAVRPIAGAAFTECPQDTDPAAEQPALRQTAERPMLGVAFAGGAEDGRTFLYDLGFVEGVKGIRNTPMATAPSSFVTSTGRMIRHQGSKQPMLDMRVDLGPVFEDLSLHIIKPEDFPRQAPIGIYTIGQVAIVTVPAEFTTMMGIRAKRAVKAALDSQPEHVELIGLANEYLMYVATPEEYEAQHYEGASTLYGPASGPLFLKLLTELAQSDPAEPGVRMPPGDIVRYYRPGPSKSFTLRDIGEPPYLPDDGLEQLLVAPVETCAGGQHSTGCGCRPAVSVSPSRDNKTIVSAREVQGPGNPQRQIVGCKWQDEFPSFRWSTRVTPSVEIVEGVEDPQSSKIRWCPLEVNGIPENDTGLRFVTVALEAGQATSEWVVFWLLTPEVRNCVKGKRLRFKIKGVDGKVRYSELIPVGPQHKRLILKVEGLPPGGECLELSPDSSTIGGS